MSNKAPKYSKSQKRKRPPVYPQAKPRIGSKVLAIALTLCTLIGGLAAVVTFMPRPSVTQGDPVDPHNTFSAPFTIANGSVFPLSHVTAELAVGQVQGFDKGPLNPNFVPDFTSKLIHPFWLNHTLKMDERFTITPDQVFHAAPGTGAGEADIAIVVSFQPWFVPLTRERMFHFRTYKQTDGKLYWYSLPTN